MDQHRYLDETVKQSQCTLLGGPYEIFVQLVLAITAVAALVYKRSLESNRRSWLVWFLDCSKQAYASALQHITNMVLGVLFARGGTASECSWYLVNFTITVACGLVLLSMAMRLYNSVVERNNWTLLRMGEYGTPPLSWKQSWKPWFAQTLAWGLLASAEKLVTAFVVILPLRSWLDSVASFLEAPLVGRPRLELVLTMVVGPMLLNALFYWVIDGLIMRRRVHSDSHQEIGEAVVASSGKADAAEQDSRQEYQFMEFEANRPSKQQGNGHIVV
mmetsp:Transcript_9616/g.26953  ORF Transcript_9616/g.26953 Transcript_9616/m.26953 type:complete len:274 (+) Transcript_9616:189-1010(+)|eukprot:CAMPEP_0181037958 /NCGR_PEP_ID=MMETSP1070-20121207/9681_1 /TAXON_ID=265543 /ORGANISM="Minutocellus polymorphus, Strain NH13" /LENGTH=273 /DNA_ID=CAMNT_0023115713 /DNA_START=103 /DNA_END=924 /DNA_ORIENTATION=+